jgi:hypothetical protein
VLAACRRYEASFRDGDRRPTAPHLFALTTADCHAIAAILVHEPAHAALLHWALSHAPAEAALAVRSSLESQPSAGSLVDALESGGHDQVETESDPRDVTALLQRMSSRLVSAAAAAASGGGGGSDDTVIVESAYEGAVLALVSVARAMPAPVLRYAVRSQRAIREVV